MAPIELPGDGVALDESEFSVEIEHLGFGPEATALHDRLRQRVIGQDRACTRIARAYSVQTAGLGDVTLPAGAYLFAGPTGVGKTYAAEELARFIIADTPRAPLARIAGGELKERHQASTLIGAPPSYTGHDNPALLSQLRIDEPQFWVRVEPYLKGRYSPNDLENEFVLAVLMDLYRRLGPYQSVILFDEVEKMHEEIGDYFLHILEDGELAMSDGSVTRFSNSYIILACNVGEEQQQNILCGRRGEIGFGTESAQEREDKDAAIYEQTLKEIKNKFSAALVGRLRNEIIVFRTLDKANRAKVLELMLSGVRKMVNGGAHSRSIPLTLQFSDAFKAFLLDEGYDVLYGLRPLRKTVYRHVTLPLANVITNGEAKAGDMLLFTMADDGEGKTPKLFRKPRPDALRVSDEEADKVERTTVPMGSGAMKE